MLFFFFFSSRRRHTRWNCDWSSDVCSSDLPAGKEPRRGDECESEDRDGCVEEERGRPDAEVAEEFVRDVVPRVHGLRRRHPDREFGGAREEQESRLLAAIEGHARVRPAHALYVFSEISAKPSVGPPFDSYAVTLE